MANYNSKYTGSQVDKAVGAAISPSKNLRTGDSDALVAVGAFMSVNWTAVSPAWKASFDTVSSFIDAIEDLRNRSQYLKDNLGTKVVANPTGATDPVDSIEIDGKKYKIESIKKGDTLFTDSEGNEVSYQSEGVTLGTKVVANPTGATDSLTGLQIGSSKYNVKDPRVEYLTQAQYDALSSKKTDVCYVIIDDTGLDTEITKDSENAVTSGAVYTAMANKQGKLKAGTGIAIAEDGTISLDIAVADKEGF